MVNIVVDMNNMFCLSKTDTLYFILCKIILCMHTPIFGSKPNEEKHPDKSHY